MWSKWNRRAASTAAFLLGLYASFCAFAAGDALVSLLLVVAGPTLTVAVHEAGHALGAWRMGLDVRAIGVGPFEYDFTGKRFRLSRFEHTQDLGGYVLIGDTPAKPLTRKGDFWSTLAGPLANLLTGILFLGVALALGIDQIAYDNHGMGWFALAMMSFTGFLLSIWPHTSRDGFRSDGRVLLDIGSGARPRRRF